MTSYKARVGLTNRGNRREKTLHALELVRDDIEPKLREQVMLKPNFLSSHNQLASSHVDAIRGVIDFLLTTTQPLEEIIIAEGGNEKYSGEAFETFDYHALPEEYDIPIRLIDLNQEQNWETTPIVLADGSEYEVYMPKTVLDCPCTISVAVAKTHDVCVTTLGLKNMIMGTVRRQDRVRMHGFHSHTERKLPDESKVLSVNLMRLAKYLGPNITVIDGTRGLQGNGPGGTDGIDFGVAAASADVYAADSVMAKAMGFDPLKLGWLSYAHELGYGTVDLAQIEILGSSLEEVTRSFRPHEKTHLQLQWQDARMRHYLPV